MHKRKKRPKPRQPRQITEKELLDYPDAVNALDTLTRDGADRNQLLRSLCELLLVPDTKQTLVLGMSDKALRNLPRRMRAWADEIARVNNSIYLNPEHLPKTAHAFDTPDLLPRPLNRIFTPEYAERTAANFQTLPRILRLYADYLREWLPNFKFLGRHGIRPQTLLILNLIKIVRDSCGSPHHKQVATLLEAAFEAAGRPTNFDAGDLQKLRRNNPTLWALLHPEIFS